MPDNAVVGQRGPRCLSDSQAWVGFSRDITVEAGSIPERILEINALLAQGERARASDLLDASYLQELMNPVTQGIPQKNLVYIVATLLQDLGRIDEAIPWYQCLAEQQPHPALWVQLANLYQRRVDQYDRALDCFAKAHALVPDDPVYQTEYGRFLMRIGASDKGWDLIKRAAKADFNNADIQKTYLWYSLYRPEINRSELAQGYTAYAERFLPGPVSPVVHTNDPNPDRCIRLGIISADFRRHPASIPIGGLLNGYDPKRLEIVGYLYGTTPDDVTADLAPKCILHRNFLHESPGEVAQQIQADKIDILMEVGGYVSHNPLPVLALRPAPIQVDYGQLGTTGMSQIDYRIADTALIPASHVEDYTEEIVNLPGGSSCFVPPQQSPPVQMQPFRRNGFITFGAFNNIAKLTPSMVQLWGRILQSVPDSRFILKCPSSSALGIQESLQAMFIRLGIDVCRIQILGRTSYDEYLHHLSRTDLLLDTYPYGGWATVAEGLWMGVPTVARVGDVFVSRMAYSLLQQLGLEIFAAQSDEAYVEKAISFARQPEALEKIRGATRSLMLNSPTCNLTRLAQEMTDCFEFMWRRWCHTQNCKTNPGCGMEDVK